MNIVLDTTGYVPVDILVVDVILQPNVFKNRLAELKGRMTGDTKDFYGSFFKEAKELAKVSLDEEIKSGGFAGVCDVRVNTFFQDVRGDVFIGATIQAIALKKERTDG